MDFLSPAKVLVILVVALAVLGPDKLPNLARQVGGLWRDFSRFRQKLESDVRGTFPDLPSTETITKAVRAPLSFLDTLAEPPGATDDPETTAPEAVRRSPGSSVGVLDAVTPQPPDSDEGTHWPEGIVTASEAPEVRISVLVAEPAGVVHEVRSDALGWSHPNSN